MDGLHTCNQHARPLTRAPAHGRQEEVFSRYHSSTHQMMYYTNMWAMLLLTIVMVFTGDGSRAVGFVAQNPAVLSKILQFGLMSATGQFFIFFLVRSFSALTLVTVTTTRKFFTVLASVFWFKHRLTLGQWLSVAFVSCPAPDLGISSGARALARARASPQVRVDQLRASIVSHACVRA